MKENKALISNIQRFSVHDGPGIRTVVFLMGCPLRCKWCQNPEMLEKKGRLLFLHDKCIGCGACAAVCPVRANEPDAQSLMRLDWTKCAQCGRCVDACPTGAREWIGTEKSVSEVERAVLSDEAFYQQSGGGVTLSGGEATMHAEFAAELFERLRGRGIHTALETCGQCETERFLRAARQTDLLLFDVKQTDDRLHRLYTGVGLELIQKNLRLAAELGKDIILRVPLIPGRNDDERNLRATARLAEEIHARELHLLPFHQAGQSKWRDSGIAYSMEEARPAEDELVQRCEAMLREYSVPVNVGGHGFYDFMRKQRKTR